MPAADHHGIITLVHATNRTISDEPKYSRSHVRRQPETIRLRYTPKPERKRKRSDKPTNEIAPGDAALWEALRAERKRIADEQGVAAFMIFYDATLRDMLARCPETDVEFLAVNGAGEEKLTRYGSAFLRLIAAHRGAAGGVINH